MKFKLTLVILITFILGIIANLYVKKINPVRIEQHKTSEVVDNCTIDDDFCTTLPIVKIDVSEDIPYYNPIVLANFKLYDNKYTSNRLTDKEVLESKIEIKYRGNSSLLFDKHQYSLKFVKDDNSEKKVSLLGMNEENHWILNGPYLDKTLIRNYLVYNIAGKITNAVPEVRFCEFYLNNEYQGVYLLIETVSRTLTGITRYKPNWSNGMSSYMLRLDRVDSNHVMLDNFTKYTGKIIYENAINIVYPAKKDLTEEIIEYINNDFSKFEKALYSYDYDEYQKYIDVDSFVDYMIINEFFKNSDAGTHSTYLYKDIRGKITMGPIWDFNNAMNNYVEEIYGYDEFLFQDKTWFNMLLKNEKFVNKVINRYRYLRKNVLSNNYIQSYINDTVNFLGKAIDRNYDVWGYTFTKESLPSMLVPSSRNYTSYEEALNQMKDYIENRGKWLDENIETLKQYCHPSVNKMYEGDKK